MLKKIFIYLLIDCFLIQIIITNSGCMSFYPIEDYTNLGKYKNYKGNILIRLKDESELEVNPTKNLYLVDKFSKFIYGRGEKFDNKTQKYSDFKGIIDNDKIDSSKITRNSLNVYHVFWMNDGSSLIFKEGDINYLTDSVNNFWVVRENKKFKFRKIYDRDIEEIQIQKVNVAETTILVVVLAGVVALMIAASRFPNLENLNLNITK